MVIVKGSSVDSWLVSLFMFVETGCGARTCRIGQRGQGDRGWRGEYKDTMVNQG